MFSTLPTPPMESMASSYFEMSAHRPYKRPIREVDEDYDAPGYLLSPPASPGAATYTVSAFNGHKRLRREKSSPAVLPQPPRARARTAKRSTAKARRSPRLSPPQPIMLRIRIPTHMRTLFAPAPIHTAAPLMMRRTYNGLPYRRPQSKPVYREDKVVLRIRLPQAMPDC